MRQMMTAFAVAATGFALAACTVVREQPQPTPVVVQQPAPAVVQSAPPPTVTVRPSY